MEKELTKNYTADTITIVWKPSACIHSAICWKKETGLPEVFDPRSKPWIKQFAASSEKIIEQIKKCPSGALSFKYNNEAALKENKTLETVVETIQNGPLLVHGNIIIKDHTGVEVKKTNVTALCRCGNSANKPFCDGSHVKHNFNT